MNSNEKTQKNKFLKVAILLLILAILIALTGYAFARYMSQLRGNAEADIAEWHFELKDGIAETTDAIDFPITRTDSNSQVDSRYIAPATYGEIPIVVDTTGTETHMKYTIDISIENCPTNLIFYKDAEHTQKLRTTRSGTGEAGDPKVATISIERWVDKNNHGEHDHTIYWDWPLETGFGILIEENDEIDTDDMNKTITMAIAAKGMQVTELEPNEEEDIPYLYAKLFDDGTLVLSSSDTMNYVGTVEKDYGNIYNMSGQQWSGEKTEITKVVIEKKIKPRYMSAGYYTTGWFYGCTNLEEIENIERLDTSKVTNMNSVFYNCDKLVTLDLNTFDTSNVTSMNAMFYSCDMLESLDISEFDTSKVTDMECMFYYNKKLKTIYAGYNFKTDNVRGTVATMFFLSSKLVGGNGTTYSGEHIDKEYARIDTTTTPGYFTLKTR